MLRSVFQNIYSFGVRVANIGISDSLTFHEKKKTQLLNVVVATGIPLNLFFCILNFAQEKPLLGIINFLLLGGSIIILVINSYRRFLLSRLILTFLASVLFIIEAVYFRNGGEYYLIANLVVIIIYFNEKKYIFLISLFNCLLFIGMRVFIQQSSFVYGVVPFGRVIFNISWSLLILVLALLFFKKEQQDYQQQVEDKNKELEELNNTKQKLFSIIAHDLRSPIGQLRNSLDLVNKEYMSPETFRQVSAKLSSEVDHLHSTLDNLLRWSLNQLQGIKAAPEKIALDELIEKNATLFRQSFETKNISFEFNTTGLSVFADPDHLMLVIRNLVSNAIKYSYHDGCITISAYEKDSHIIIEVTDTGMGMNEEIKTSIFGGSTNIVSSTGTSNEKGTGLGLKLCKEFIEKNNGHIWLESTEKKGSTFYAAIPTG
ncbi:MAG: HAMP domain-containing sensor histidine kinase [Bacteroidota bacterium]